MTIFSEILIDGLESCPDYAEQEQGSHEFIDDMEMVMKDFLTAYSVKNMVTWSMDENEKDSQEDMFTLIMKQAREVKKLLKSHRAQVVAFVALNAYTIQ